MLYYNLTSFLPFVAYGVLYVCHECGIGIRGLVYLEFHYVSHCLTDGGVTHGLGMSFFRFAKPNFTNPNLFVDGVYHDAYGGNYFIVEVDMHGGQPFLEKS